MKRFAALLLGLSMLVGGVSAEAQKDPAVGDVQMSHKDTLLGNLRRSPIHTRLVAAMTAAGLADSLGSTGHITLFAPTDDAFAQLPAGTLTGLEQPGNQDQLRRLVLYHAVNGKLTAKKLNKLVKKGKGSASLTTLAGAPLLVKRAGSILTLTDSKGGTAVIITADVTAKDDVMHVIDKVLLPQ